MTSIAEAMEKAAEAVRPYSNRLGSAVIQDIGQDAVLAFWQAQENGEELDIVAEARKLCEREYKHARKDQGIVTVPLDEVSEWLPSINVSAGSEPGMDFGVSRTVVPGVANVTRRELLTEAALAVSPEANFAVIEWLEAANAQRRTLSESGGRKGGKPMSVPKALSEPIAAQAEAVLSWWGHRSRTRQADDWRTARAMSPTTEPVLTPAELSDAEVEHYARDGKPRLRPTPIRVHTSDPESDGMAMLSFGPGKVNEPNRRSKREGQATVALGGRRNWSDVGNRAG